MLIGRGALANFHDVPPAHEAGFDDWHTREHLPERVGVPGFLRGRRYRAVDDALSPRYFILYETTDVEVLRSADYVARLDSPTPWTARVSSCMTRTIRTAARVHASAGTALGGWVLTVRLTPPDGQERGLRAALASERVATVAGTSGVCGVHVLEADPGVTGVPTAERGLRDPPDEIAPWMVLVEGTGRAAVERAWAGLRDALPAALREDAAVGVYALQIVFALCDL